MVKATVKVLCTSPNPSLRKLVSEYVGPGRASLSMQFELGRRDMCSMAGHFVMAALLAWLLSLRPIRLPPELASLGLTQKEP